MAKEENLDIVLDAIKKHLDENDTPKSLAIPIMVAVEEIFVNIAHYAYGDKIGEAKVGMEVTPDPKKVVVVFRDKGTAYNPLAKEDPDLTLGAEDRPIGGLGIYMTKELMDNMTYVYENDENVLTIEKAL